MLIVYWIRLGFDVVDGSLRPILLVYLRCWIGCMVWCQFYGVVLVVSHALFVSIVVERASAYSREDTITCKMCGYCIICTCATVSVREGGYA